MAMAGFYAIHNSEIRFGADGVWYADGDPIENDRIAALFSRSVERDPEGGYRLRVGDETASIIVDDTPYVVVDVGIAESVEIELNDGRREPLDENSLEISTDNVFYCRVGEGAESARFLRRAHYQLTSVLEEREGGGYALRIGKRVVPIRQR